MKYLDFNITSSIIVEELKVTEKTSGRFYSQQLKHPSWFSVDIFWL